MGGREIWSHATAATTAGGPPRTKGLAPQEIWLSLPQLESHSEGATGEEEEGGAPTLGPALLHSSLSDSGSSILYEWCPQGLGTVIDQPQEGRKERAAGIAETPAKEDSVLEKEEEEEEGAWKEKERKRRRKVEERKE
ncbi:hypothetical protein JD844_031699, partial [Phrynosoma platyrhinos]